MLNHSEARMPECQQLELASSTTPTVINVNDEDNIEGQRQMGKAEIVHDGGAKAWLTVLGAWLVLFSTFGYLYSFGVYQDYYTRVFLTDHTPSSIAWIGSLQLMLPFLLGAVSGRLFDAGYFHAEVIFGCLLFVFSLFMLSLAKPQHYYQVFLSQGVGMGIALGLIFVPAGSVAVHHFQKHRALASGVALSGTSLGAVVFPIMLNHLILSIGFGDAVRASGYVVLGCAFLGNCLMRMGPNFKQARAKAAFPNFKSFFFDLPYMSTSLGLLISSFGFYFPSIYLQLYAVQHDIDPILAFYSLAIMNAAGSVGRILGNWLADNFGLMTVQVPCTLLTSASIFAVLGIHNVGSLMAVSVLYGLFSGAWLALTFASLGSLARRPEEVGARTGLSFALSSIGSLLAAPIQGALLTDKFIWHRPIIFSGVTMTLSALNYAFTKTLIARERGTRKV